MNQLFVVAALFCVTILLVLVFSLLSGRRAQAGAQSDTITDVGGVNFTVHEALIGAVTSIVFVLCVAFYGRFITEANEIRAAEIMGAWQFGYSADAADNSDKIVAWLMSGGQNPLDPASDYQINLAVSLADRHVATRTAFLAIDAIVRYGIWAVAFVAIVQSILNSRQLYGLSILMPAMIITLIVVILVFFPGARDLLTLLGRQGAAAPSLVILP
ncbi:MAG: hypothetical protein WCJ41_20925 [Aestuariivirga sp.]|uniref:hypothetical protein n=1 Tax=Aestuariivirga sp. TaxID=2650926 RepID=UPI00301647D2